MAVSTSDVVTKHGFVAGKAAPALYSRISRRWRLSTVLVACSVVLALGMLALEARLHWRLAWESAAQEIQRSSDAAAEYALRVLSAHAVLAGRIDTLTAGLSDEEVRAREANLHQEMRALLAELPQAESSYVIDRTGGLLASSTVFPVPREGISVVDRDFFLALGSDDAPAVHVSRIHVGRVDQALFFTISRRRSRSGNSDTEVGQFDGLVNVSLHPERMAPRLARLAVRAGDTASLYRADGELLARSRGQNASSQMADPPWDIGAVQERTIFERISSLDGQRRLYAATRVEDWPVYAVIGRARGDIVNDWRQEVLKDVPVALLAMTALGGLSLAVRRGERGLAEMNAQLEFEVECQVAVHGVQQAVSEARLQAALAAGRVFAFEVDLDRHRISRSANAQEILGLPAADATEQDSDAMLQAVLPEDRATLQGLWQALSTASPRGTVRVRFRKPDGSVVWLESEGEGQFDATGRLVRVSGLSRDITMEAEAETARRTAQARLKVAMDGAGFGIYELDFVRRTAWFDRRGAAVLQGTLPGDTAIAIDGPEWSAMRGAIDSDDRPAFEAAWHDIVAGRKQECWLEFRIGTPQQAPAWVWCHGTVQDRCDTTGWPLRVVGMVQDVSARHELEAELRQGQKLQVLGELAAGVAHDLNNVLQIIAGQASRAKREADDAAKVLGRLATVTEAVETGAAITRRLLSFSRRTTMRTEALSPSAILHNVAALMGQSLGKRIRIEVNADAGLPAVLADEEQLKTALMNLATNARDAMPEGGVLNLGAATGFIGATPPPAGQASVPRGLMAGRHVRLWARDSGTGMDAATLERVAEPFFTTKPEGTGTGLGLAMVKAFSERSGGAMVVESVVGRGTTVSMWLPVANAAVAQGTEGNVAARTAGTCG